MESSMYERSSKNSEAHSGEGRKVFSAEVLRDFFFFLKQSDYLMETSDAVSTSECSWYAGRMKTSKSNSCCASSSTFLGVLPL